ncbi:MAG TPA: phosphate ABC transporter ATP-binding protein [Sediminispirochaeta sp.]|nr:phosphate ABC transporter ATP-binding protein [Sediminispirochaeta sp.]
MKTKRPEALQREVSPEVLQVKNLSFYYGSTRALRNIDMGIYKNRVTSIIGPSGCGKSTMLRCFNRMNDLIADTRVEGSILLNGQDIYAREVDPVRLRRHVGMVFQQPNPFPKSIFDNVAYGPRMYGTRDKSELMEIVERSLKNAALWNEVKDRLHKSAFSLSGGQQQRLCIARAIAVEPEVLLMDEPASALDPIATTFIEDLIDELKKNYTVVIVTHNMQQAGRVGDYTAFFLNGELEEFDGTDKIFLDPSSQKTADYISGRFG